MVVALLPGALVVGFAFSAGGYSPGATARGIVVLGALLLVTVVADRRRRSRLPRGRCLVLACCALVMLALWTLASAAWSGAPWRALVELDRVLLYLLALALFGSLATGTDRVRQTMRGLAAAIGIVCLAALTARLLPGLYPAVWSLGDYGLAYPVTYANALGLLAVLGLLLCLHLASDAREPRSAALLGTAAVPLLVTTLVLTRSVGAALAGIVGLAVLVAVARPRALGGTALATIPTGALAALTALGAGALAGADVKTAEAVAQGQEVAAVVALSAANAALIRWLTLRRSGGASDAVSDAAAPVRDKRGAQSSAPARRGLLRLAAGVGLAVAVAVAAGLLLVGLTADGGGPAAGAREGAGSAEQGSRPPREPARVDHWRVALGGFAEAPLIGGGAGTYEILSQRERSPRAAVRDAHSLPVESLAELGITGFALLLAALAFVLRGLAAGVAGRDRELFGAVLAVAVAWTVHAAIDWDWEMPVVTVPVLALCGAALGAQAAARPARQSSPRPAARFALGAVLVALIAAAALIAVSEAQLARAVGAARTGDCMAAGAAADHFPASVRPEPHATLARCELRRARATSGRERRRHAERAVLAFDGAVRRDPGDRAHRAGLARARRLAAGGAP